MPKTRKPYPPEFRDQLAHWSGPGVPSRISLASLNRRPSRSATGWPKPIAMPVGGRRPHDGRADAAPTRESAAEAQARDLVKSRDPVRGDTCRRALETQVRTRPRNRVKPIRGPRPSVLTGTSRGYTKSRFSEACSYTRCWNDDSLTRMLSAYLRVTCVLSAR